VKLRGLMPNGKVNLGGKHLRRWYGAQMVYDEALDGQGRGPAFQANSCLSVGWEREYEERVPSKRLPRRDSFMENFSAVYWVKSREIAGRGWR